MQYGPSISNKDCEPIMARNGFKRNRSFHTQHNIQEALDKFGLGRHPECQ